MMHLSDNVDRIIRRKWFPRIVPAVDAQRSKQYALASMLASEDFDWGMYPKQWQHRFNRSLKVIQQFDKEFEEAR